MAYALRIAVLVRDVIKDTCTYLVYDSRSSGTLYVADLMIGNIGVC